MSAAPTGEPLLPSSLLAQLERVQLGTRRRLAGRFTGEHRSPRHGTSLDFADYREYHPGDDFRRIDAAVFARTGQLVLRLFEAEDDVSLRIVLDVSASMGYHGKLRQAVRMAAALGFLALTRRDVVTVHLHPATRPPRRFSGRHAVDSLFTALAEIESAGTTDLAATATEVLAQTGPVGITVLVSDLLTPSWEPAIDRLPMRGGEIVVLHVLAAEELTLDLHGDVDVVDAETGAHIPISVAHDTIRNYEDVVRAWLDEASARCVSRGATYHRVMAADPVEDVLLRGWREQGLVR